MSKFLGLLFKASLFTSIVLILGAWIDIGGRSISGHIESQIRKAKHWEVTEKVNHWSSGVLKNHHEGEDIQSSEREKLKRLISDLNR